ncbi:putative HELICASE domain protein [Mycobacterium xenopi 4042]|uniref:Putative HELICASE domain protein n=1 Tax=Mycobacterium xenopi 4042 TaxID=1299334 RepID=X8BE50_MYCXE|nr:putative HELICASE domain protein [Mycobacterium xenopi 4042]
MADLVAEGARTLTFVRSRRGAELTALAARSRLRDIAPELADKVASYRRVISPRSAARSRMRWPRAGCAVWPPPTHSSWASTSRAWMPW